MRLCVVNPTKKRMEKIYYRGFTVQIIIIFICGLCSYLSLGSKQLKEESVDLFLFRKSITETDILFNFCRILALISFLLSAVIGLFPLKENILDIINKRSS